MSETYDATQLDRLGKRRLRLRADLEAVNAELDSAILDAAHQGLAQAEIVRRTGLTRESVAQKMLPKPDRWKRRQS